MILAYHWKCQKKRVSEYKKERANVDDRFWHKVGKTLKRHHIEAIKAWMYEYGTCDRQEVSRCYKEIKMNKDTAKRNWNEAALEYLNESNQS
jgi:hypothetical protein